MDLFEPMLPTAARSALRIGAPDSLRETHVFVVKCDALAVITRDTPLMHRFVNLGFALCPCDELLLYSDSAHRQQLEQAKELALRHPKADRKVSILVEQKIRLPRQQGMNFMESAGESCAGVGETPLS